MVGQAVRKSAAADFEVKKENERRSIGSNGKNDRDTNPSPRDENKTGRNDRPSDNRRDDRNRDTQKDRRDDRDRDNRRDRDRTSTTKEDTNSKTETKEGEKVEKKFTGRCRLFVGNLTSDITEREFRDLFKPFGECSEPYLNQARGFGFIKLDTRQHAEAAKHALDGTARKLKILRVRFATHGAALKVKNLSQCVSNELLEKAFSQFGEVERAIVIVDDRGRSTGEGIVEFARKPGASQALSRISEGVFLLTTSPRPVVVEPLEQKDEEDGLPERYMQKNQNFQKEREEPPRFASIGSFEFEFAQRWKQLHVMKKEQEENLQKQVNEAIEKLEMDMENAIHEQKAHLLRQDLMRRQEELRRLEEMRQEQQMRRQNDELRRNEERRRQEEMMRQQQEEMRQRRGGNMDSMGMGMGGGMNMRGGNNRQREEEMLRQQQEEIMHRRQMEMGGGNNMGGNRQDDIMMQIANTLATNKDQLQEKAMREMQGGRGGGRGGGGAPPMQPPPQPPASLRGGVQGAGGMQGGQQGYGGGMGSQGQMGMMGGGGSQQSGSSGNPARQSRFDQPAPSMGGSGNRGSGGNFNQYGNQGGSGMNMGGSNTKYGNQGMG
ncbi:unnamed protein product, partial [Owenia fusiformis]